MNFELLHPADQLVMLMERIYRYGMTTTSGGNLSILDENGDIFDDLYNEVVAFSAGEHDGIGLWNRIVYDTVSINYVNLYKQVIAQA